MSDAAVLVEHLRVGMPAILQVDIQRPNGLRHKTRVRGWQVGTYIVLDRPKHADEAEQVSLHLQQECVVRFLAEGLAVGFRSAVLDIGFSRFHPQVSIHWPSEITSLPTRAVERAQVDLPCLVEVADGGTHDAQLENIGLYGCSVRLPRALQPGAVLRFSCQLSEAHQVESCPITVLQSAPLNAAAFQVRCRIESGQSLAQHEIIRDFIRGMSSEEAA